VSVFLRCLSALLTLAAALLAPDGAAAWKQTVSHSGLELAWPGSCYHWSLNRDGCSTIAFEDLRAAARAAYAAWEEPECGYFHFVETVPTGVAEQAFHDDARNANALVWHEEPGTWPYGPAVIALASVHYDPSTGDIRDADIEFNGVDQVFAVLDEGDTGEGALDLQSVLTHEIGHTLGLDHSDSPDAVMHSGGDTGGIWRRELSGDDVEGLCAIYPASEDPGVCEGPWCGFDEDGTAGPCELDAGAECGCAAPGARRAVPGMLRLLAGLLFHPPDGAMRKGLS